MFKAHGHVIGGPPCSSWVWIARGSTKRCRLRPQGSKRYAAVRKANKLARRLLYLNLASTKSNDDSLCLCRLDLYKYINICPCPLCFVVLAFHACADLRLEAAHKRGCYWTIEQPRSSLLGMYQPFKEELQFLFVISSQGAYLLRLARRPSRGIGQSLFTFPWVLWEPQQ